MSLLEFITTWAAKCWVLALISLLELKGEKTQRIWCSLLGFSPRVIQLHSQS